MSHKSLHILLKNEQKEFDEQVLSLTKTLIDSINEKRLKKEIGKLPDDTKGIDKLELFFQTTKMNTDDSKKVIKFLRNLQKLRSTGIAHLKGKDYEKTRQEQKIDNNNLPAAFDNILKEAIEVLDCMHKHFLI